MERETKMTCTEPPLQLREMKIELTHACGLHCVHCSSVAEANCARTMTEAECTRILQQAAEIGVEELAFSGGEPLLWKNLPDAVAFAAAHRMRVLLYTSGNAPRAQWLLKQMKSAGLAAVMFSVFGADADHHERVTKVPGSFARTIEAIRECRRLGLPVELHFVPMADNYVQLPAVAQMGVRLGASRVSVLRLVPQGRGATGLERQLSYEQNGMLGRTICQLRDANYDIRTGSPYNFLMLNDNPDCRSGVDRLTVGPDLRIFPCDAFKHISPADLGAAREYCSLKEHALAECWQKSPYLAVVREHLRTPQGEMCSSCSSVKRCLSGCMAQKFHAYGALVKAPDPMCRLRAAKEPAPVTPMSRDATASLTPLFS
jgi:radical SAM protein with 4Fe4S-binding SPASM domain